MIGVYIALGAVGVLAVILVVILLRMSADQRRTRETEEKLRAEEKVQQDSIREKLIKLEALAENPAQAKTLDEINKRLESTTNLFGAIRKDLGEMQQAAKGMQDVGKSISTFQELLISPKVRGGFGEVLLEELIKDVLPSVNYAFQYKFRDGTIVDAVIKTEDRIIPIDSKFPLEEFQRMAAEELTEEKFKSSFKKIMRPRVNEVKKYINPDEGTVNFALMYIPSEKLYSRLSGIDELMVSFRRVRVFPVSPSTLYQFLETIILGLRGLAIEKEAQRILDTLNRLAKEFDSAREEWERVGTHIGNASKKYEEVSKRLGRIGDNIKALEVKTEKVQEQKEIPYD
ncbi:DNA recombination protein RmuC [candidate division WOR-3 bacterium]|uniref:DNA recombination protein RmuC n=1 Tax=candidate division WOR-3 bacterium TaxID=2052148 RepID=A0A9D5K8Z8_UNCW3|nr:DNA recombination protein RmuC [candidate division WOR-3 bacterium]MBD3364329.1 DNA recombination protein RmuC [candidate division WOR-3 bacterium]